MEKAIEFLKTFTELDTVNETTVKTNVIERDNKIILDAEGGNTIYFADYYGEFRGGFPWINSRLENGLAKLGFFLEWENPACLTLCRI